MCGDSAKPVIISIRQGVSRLSQRVRNQLADSAYQIFGYTTSTPFVSAMLASTMASTVDGNKAATETAHITQRAA